jgi:prepilin-type N-terminal cleavage/methylation domain-containing protein
MHRIEIPQGGRGAKRAGFTMVEVMVAIGVLLVAVVTAFGSQLTSYGLMTSSREDNAAIADLAACMEEVMLRTVDSLPVAGSKYEHGAPIVAYEGLHLRDQRIVATYPGYVAGGVVPDPLTIVLTATWSDTRGRARRVELRSLKVR